MEKNQEVSFGTEFVYVLAGFFKTDTGMVFCRGWHGSFPDINP